MKISLFWVGRTREKFIKEAIKKYIKDIGTMADIEVMEIKEEKGAGPDGRGAFFSAGLRREGERILRQAGDFFILLDEAGKKMSSVEFAELLRERLLDRGATCRFVVGGPFGVSSQVKEAASMRLSLSPMTFPHELARVVLLEQIYRGLSIIKGRGYHHA